MKICLIRCPSPFLLEDKVFPPLGLMSVGTVLKRAGHDVIIHDGDMVDIPMNCDAYGLGPTTPEHSYALTALELIREQNFPTRIIIGGPHVLLKSNHYFNKADFDCVVRGDGEPVVNTAFVSKVKSIDGGEDNSLDDYPPLDYSLINLKSYKYKLNGIPCMTMISSRGCPYHCAFCFKNYTKIRYRSVENVISEIRDLHFTFGYNALAFPEDIFILNKKRTETICSELKRLGIIFRCLIRADVLIKHGLSFARMLAESGCVEVGMGIESGSEQILKTINKGETSSTIRKAIFMMKDVGLKVKGFFIMGLPGESKKTIDETRRFLDEVDLDDLDIKIYQPFPGTPIWNNKDKFDIDWDKDEDWSHMFYKGRPGEYYGSVRTSHLSTDLIYREWVSMENTYKKWTYQS
jgi:radical SAM superfamily enzyme YgiQ (UPF0313 family)